MGSSGSVRVQETGEGAPGGESSVCRGLEVRGRAGALSRAPSSCPGLSRTWPACSFFLLFLFSRPPRGLLRPLCPVCCLTSPLSFLFWALLPMAGSHPCPVLPLRQGRAVRGPCPHPLPHARLGRGLFVSRQGFVSRCVCVPMSMRLGASACTLWSRGQDPASGHPRSFVLALVQHGGGRGRLVRAERPGFRGQRCSGGFAPSPHQGLGPGFDTGWGVGQEARLPTLAPPGLTSLSVSSPSHLSFPLTRSLPNPPLHVSPPPSPPEGPRSSQRPLTHPLLPGKVKTCHPR